ncbi:MAG: hypothetical protein STSR0006_13520 [Lentimicrobium sp.]|nr:hypothetical protein [Bacteroidales bacterium]
MAFLYRPKPKQYEHKFIYYNADEERAKKLREEAEPTDPTTERLRRDIERQWALKQKKKKSSNISFIVYLLLILFLLYIIFILG